MWQMVTYRRQFLKPASRGSCALNFPPAPQREEEEGEKMCAKVTAPPPLSFPLFRHSLDPFSGTSWAAFKACFSLFSSLRHVMRGEVWLLKRFATHKKGKQKIIKWEMWASVFVQKLWSPNLTCGILFWTGRLFYWDLIYDFMGRRRSLSSRLWLEPPKSKLGQYQKFPPELMRTPYWGEARWYFSLSK